MGGPGRVGALDSVAGMNATRLHTTSFFSLSSIQNRGPERRRVEEKNLISYLPSPNPPPSLPHASATARAIVAALNRSNTVL